MSWPTLRPARRGGQRGRTGRAAPRAAEVGEDAEDAAAPVVTPALHAAEVGEVEPVMPCDPRAAKVGEFSRSQPPTRTPRRPTRSSPSFLSPHELRTAPPRGQRALEADATSPARPSLMSHHVMGLR